MKMHNIYHQFDLIYSQFKTTAYVDMSILKINLYEEKPKALKKTKLILFASRILPCKQNCVQYKHFTPQIPTGTDRGIHGVSKGTDVDWCGKVRGWGIPCNTECLPNAGPTKSACPMPC